MATAFPDCRDSPLAASEHSNCWASENIQVCCFVRKCLIQYALLVQRNIKGCRACLAVERFLWIELDVGECLIFEQLFCKIGIGDEGAQVNPIVKGGSRF